MLTLISDTILVAFPLKNSCSEYCAHCTVIFECTCLVKCPPSMSHVSCHGTLCSSGVMSQNIWGGTIFARERSDQARGSVATERGQGVGGGCPPSHGRELFHFSTLKMCNLGHT